jgi:hypothetical protein
MSDWKLKFPKLSHFQISFISIYNCIFAKFLHNYNTNNNRMNQTKYIFVTGGVTSSLGKGIIAASLAKLLQTRGYRTTIQSLTPILM